MSDTEPALVEDVNQPSEIAHALESSPVVKREEIWSELTPQQQGEVFPLVNTSVSASLLSHTNTEEIVQLTEHMTPKSIADVISMVADDVGLELIDSLSGNEKVLVENTLQYDEGMVGRLLDFSVVTVNSKRTVAQVLDYIRGIKLSPYTDLIFVVGNKNKLLGSVKITTLIEASLDTNITDLEYAEIEPLLDQSSQHDAALLFRQKYFVSMPVVDQQQKLIGRVTLDDFVNIIRSDARQQIMGRAGLKKDQDLFEPIIPSSKRRAVWLGINLLTAFLASWAIGLFSATLEQVVALAVLMPIVASMGGIAGSQTLTLTIRGLALQQIDNTNRNALLYREVGVALLNGLLWSAVVGLITWVWFSDEIVAAVITIAIFVNVLTAAFAGWLVPLILNARKIDPAISGSVVLTTVTDIVGFVTFLGLGTLWLI